MRRSLLALLALLGSSSLISAQAQFIQVTPTPDKLDPDAIVARLLNFDQNHDGQVTITELSERMHPLMARGDMNADGALNLSEIRALALSPRTVVQVQGGRGFGPGSGGYSFGDDAGFSSKLHIEGALDDLRLTADKKERALPIVQAYADTVEQAAKADLVRQMEPVLSPQLLATFTTMLDTQQRNRVVTMKGPGEARQVVQVLSMRMGGDLTRRLEAMQLGTEKTEQAKKAIEDFKARIRLGTEPERAGLLAQLKDVLNAEELENYGAALARRPVVANNVQFVFASEVMRNEIIDVARPAVLIEKAFPPDGVSVR